MLCLHWQIGSDQEHDLDDASDHMADMEEGMDQATTRRVRWVWVDDASLG